MIVDDRFDRLFLDAFEEVLGWGVQVREDDRPGTVEGWDSLAQIRLIHELETRFDVRLPDDALLQEQSVGSLRELVLASVTGS